MGGWDKVTLLGWSFAPSIGQFLETLPEIKDHKLEVLVIPPDLLDQLKSKTSFKKLQDQVAIQADGTIRTPIRFAPLQYLTVKDPVLMNGNLRIELDNYVLLSSDMLPLDEKNRKALNEVIAREPLALIEYWAVDTDYDGNTFRSVWQDYRENIENDVDSLRVSTKVVLPYDGSELVAVKAVDVFGLESEVIIPKEQIIKGEN